MGEINLPMKSIHLRDIFKNEMIRALGHLCAHIG